MMKRAFRDRPWLLVVLALGLFLLMSAVSLAIAFAHPPDLLR